MRISDWSSDVCSSDLRMFPKSRAARARRALIAAACAALLLAACGSEQAPADTSDATTAPAAAGEVNLYTTREPGLIQPRSEEHTSELQSLMRISYAVFCLKKKKHTNNTITHKSTK